MSHGRQGMTAGRAEITVRPVSILGRRIIVSRSMFAATLLLRYQVKQKRAAIGASQTARKQNPRPAWLTTARQNPAESSSRNRWQLKQGESCRANQSDALETNESLGSSNSLTKYMTGAKRMNSKNSCNQQEQLPLPQNKCELVSWRVVGLTEY